MFYDLDPLEKGCVHVLAKRYRQLSNRLQEKAAAGLPSHKEDVQELEALRWVIGKVAQGFRLDPPAGQKVSFKWWKRTVEQEVVLALPRFDYKKLPALDYQSLYEAGESTKTAAERVLVILATAELGRGR